MYITCAGSGGIFVSYLKTNRGTLLKTVFSQKNKARCTSKRHRNSLLNKTKTALEIPESVLPHHKNRAV
jgi:hypothetical protein